MLIFCLTFIDDFDDKKLFENLFYSYRKQMVYLAMSYIHNQDDAEDIVHDVFLNIAQRHMSIIKNIKNDEDVRTLKGVLNKAVTVQQDDIRFDYYMFDSKSTADYYRGLYISYTRSNRYDVKNVEFSERLANYTIYTIKAAGMYTAVVMVDNTLVFAYSDSENSSVIYDMIVDIGYFDKD